MSSGMLIIWCTFFLMILYMCLIFLFVSIEDQENEMKSVEISLKGEK